MIHPPNNRWPKGITLVIFFFFKSFSYIFMQNTCHYFVTLWDINFNFSKNKNVKDVFLCCFVDIYKLKCEICLQLSVINYCKSFLRSMFIVIDDLKINIQHLSLFFSFTTQTFWDISFWIYVYFNLALNQHIFNCFIL